MLRNIYFLFKKLLSESLFVSVVERTYFNTGKLKYFLGQIKQRETTTGVHS